MALHLGKIDNPYEDLYNQYLSKVKSSTTNPKTEGTGALGDTGANIGEYVKSALATDPRLKTVESNISGNLPEDVKRNLAQMAAERGISIGSYGGAGQDSALLRALGLTSLDLINKGIEQYGSMVSGVPKPSPENLIVTPAESLRNALNANATLMNRVAMNSANTPTPLTWAAYNSGGTTTAGAPLLPAATGGAPTPTTTNTGIGNYLNSLINRLSGGANDELVGTTPTGGTPYWLDPSRSGDTGPMLSGWDALYGNTTPAYSFDFNPLLDNA